MRQNNSFEDELKNPMNIAIMVAAMVVVVVLFCVIVWNVTHREDKTIVSNKTEQTQDTVESSSNLASSDEVVATPEPSEELDTEDAAIEALLAAQSNDQGVVFTETRDIVTAKGVTNLRSEPSTAQAEATVVMQLNNGENALRVGYNEEVGWSKLIYEDQVLYASTAYLSVVEEAGE